MKKIYSTKKILLLDCDRAEQDVTSWMERSLASILMKPLQYNSQYISMCHNILKFVSMCHNILKLVSI